MSLRPPSNLREYDDFYSGDPAIVQLADGATDDEKKEHARRLEVARETGDWSPILVDGQQPTKFVLKVLTGDVHRKLMDDYSGGRFGLSALMQVAFRIALKGVVNCGDVTVNHQQDVRYGKLAKADVTDALDAIDPAIVNELGGEVLRRAREPAPKS